ncbi:LysM peptidoglycan-binding domain-containing protein [Nocardia sp. NPDC003482]
MRTPISEFAPADGDLGLDSAPRAHRLPARGGLDTRRPRRPRPVSAPVRYERLRVRAGAGAYDRGHHPMRRVERARVGFATLAVTALLTAVVVAALVGVAQLRSPADTPGPTTVVQVQEGESLSEIAERVAPDAPVRDTVRKIVDLNGLRGAEVTTGRTLIVPAPPH